MIKQVLLPIPQEIHEALKQEAKLREITFPNLCTVVFREWLESQKVKP